jgi:hypothetical protein
MKFEFMRFATTSGRALKKIAEIKILALDSRVCAPQTKISSGLAGAMAIATRRCCRLAAPQH